MGIAGGFGSGKSHFLGYLAEVARAQNFVVSRVVVSKETPLSDPARVFEAAVRAATLPDRHDDAITGALTILRQSRDKMAALETAVEQAGDALAPIFSALLFLLQRDTLPAGFARQMERFLAGGKIRGADVRQALAAVGGARKFDLRLPAAGLLLEQRIQFLTALLHAAGLCRVVPAVRRGRTDRPLYAVAAGAGLCVAGDVARAGGRARVAGDRRRLCHHGRFRDGGDRGARGRGAADRPAASEGAAP